MVTAGDDAGGDGSMKPTPSVLVLDDDRDHAMLVADIVRDARYEVTSLSDPQKALGALERRSFDVFITDLCMPGMDGIELIERVKVHDPRIAIIAMTGFGSLQTGMRALRAGATDYLAKPFEPKELRIRIEQVLESRAKNDVIDRLRQQANDFLKRSRDG
jgi:two-component system response regulator HydG